MTNSAEANSGLVLLSASPGHQDDQRLPSVDEAKLEAAVGAIARALARRGCGLIIRDEPKVVAAIARATADLDRTLDLRIHHLAGQAPSPACEQLPAAKLTEVEGDATLLAETMVCLRPMRAALFVGGGPESFEHAALFRLHNPREPMVALGTTGGAARALLDGAPLAPHLRASVAWAELQDADSPIHDLVMKGDALSFTGAPQKIEELGLSRLRSSEDLASLIATALDLADRLVSVKGEDYQALQQWLGGDKQAGERLFEKYYSLLDDFFRTRVRDTERGDLVHNTFISLMQTARGFRGDCTFRSHIYRIAKRTLYDHYRKFKVDLDPLVDSIADIQAKGASTALSEINRFRAVQRCLDALTLDERTLLELYYWERKRSHEIAPILEIAPQTVRWRVSRIKRKLLECYQRDNPDSGRLADEDDLETKLRELARLLTEGLEPGARLASPDEPSDPTKPS